MNRNLAILSLLVVALAGCVTPAQPPAEPLDDNDTSGNGTDTGGGRLGNNTSLALKPPVARMQIYGGSDGALVFESNFVAENVTDHVVVPGGEEIRFVGSESKAVEPTAKIETWRWDFGDGAKEEGRSVTHAFSDLGGTFRVTLTVTDSHNSTDTLFVTLGVDPTRTYTVAVNQTGSLQVGTLGQVGQADLDVVEFPLTVVAEMEGFPVEMVGAEFVVSNADPASDFDLLLLDAAGEVVASTAGEPILGAGEPAPPIPSGSEGFSLDAGELAPGAYTLRVVLYFGALGAFSLDGAVQYRVVNPEAGHGGGHAH